MKKALRPHSLASTTGGDLLEILRVRLEAHMRRHPGLSWDTVRARLDARPERLRSLQAMEESGGEPDVLALDPISGEIVFVDFAPESPKGRVSLCYDREGLESRKEHKPKTSALDLATEMGIELLTEAEYFELQTRGEFDQKTSSWLRTPPELRALGGALFGDRRYGRVFIYHNGAQSYYAVRGFRGSLRV